MTFTIYLQDGTSIDLKDDVQVNTLQIGARCDEAFASGSCQVITTEIYRNIPPYTIANIDGIKYCISSECTKYQNSSDNAYVHNIAILELSAILEGFIVGSKVLSVENDRLKLSKILVLVGNKYNVELSPDATFNFLIDQFNDYVFGSTTTLYDALTQMCIRGNYRPRVEDAYYNQTTGKLHIDIEAFDLSSQATKSLAATRIMQHTVNQSSDTYSLYLEQESGNVVDRTTPTYDTNLTIRNKNETRLTIDNGKLYTTSPIESVNKLEVMQYAAPSFSGMMGQDFFKYFQIGYDNNMGYLYDASAFTDQATSQPIIHKMSYWIEKSMLSGDTFTTCAIYRMLDYYCRQNNLNINNILNADYYVNYLQGSTDTFTKDGVTYRDTLFTLVPKEDIAIAPYDITNHILEKSQYDAEQYSVQPKYCYYTKGSNVIDGLHVIRNDDLWSKIAAVVTGSSTGPMMGDVINEYNQTSSPINYTDNGPVTDRVYDFYGTLYLQNANDMTTLFNVEYIAVNKPSMRITKEDTPINETAYKPISKVFGVSAELVDYDRLVSSMKKYAEMWGKPETTIEYDITDVAVSDMPNLTNYINVVFGGSGYLMSYNIRYHNTYRVMTMNLCNSYSKVAEAVSVAYQYNASLLPIDGIISRPIYIPMHLETIPDLDNLYLKLDFQTPSKPTRSIITRVSPMSFDFKTVLCCEADDQFSFGSKVVNYDIYSVTELVQYANSDNTVVESVNVSLIKFDGELSTNDSRALPDGSLITGTYTTLATKNNVVIYKDPREKLTFTIEII